jgi:glycosyltransferase involved in cell wall biosynthesis
MKQQQAVKPMVQHSTVTAFNNVPPPPAPMRIAEIVDSLEIGGAERMVVDLSCCLKERGHSLHVICLRDSGPLARILAEAGIEVLALKKPDGFSVARLVRLRRYLQNAGIDIVHTHNPLVHHYGALAGRLAGVPVVVSTLHGLSNLNGVDRTSRIYKSITRLTDRIVAVCQIGQECFERAGLPPHKLRVIYNGIPLERFVALQPEPDRQPIVFGAVGRLVAIKNHASLLKAFRLAHERYPPCRLEILGDGPLRHDLEKLACELGLGSSVRFRGFSLEVAPFFESLNTFVISSLSEGLPLTVLEAMASGLPVIGTAVGGIPELVNAAGCGWLCPPDRPDLLADSMMAAIQSKQRSGLGMRARSYVVERYSLRNMTCEYEHLFERLLGHERRH